MSKGWIKWRRPLYWCVALIGGVFVSSQFQTNQKGLVVLIVAALLLAILWRQFIPAVFIGLFFLGFGYFWLFARLSSPAVEPGCYEAKVATAPRKIGSNDEFALDLGTKSAVVQVEEGDFKVGDLVKICLTKRNLVAVSSQQRRSLESRYRTDQLITSPEIALVEPGRGTLRRISELSSLFKNTLYKLFPGNAGALAVGLLLGGSESFSSQVKAALTSSGTTHLVAVSGYNISIITVIIFRFLRRLSGRNLAALLSLAFLVVFPLLAGLTPSVFRAAIMGALYLIGRLLGRPRALLDALFVAALAMTVSNPYVLWDVGFQLSFAATFGLIWAAPLAEYFGNFLRRRGVTLQEIGGVLTETLVAQLFTLPILLFAFGRISLVAPLTNLLILPFVPAAMFFISLALGGFFVWSYLGQFFAGVAKLLLDYFLALIGFFGQTPWALYNARVGALAAVGLYAVILMLSTLARRLAFRRATE